MTVDVLIEPQPVIRGSYLSAGSIWHVSAIDDIDRLAYQSQVPWVTLISPSDSAELVKIGQKWYWRTEVKE